MPPQRNTRRLARFGFCASGFCASDGIGTFRKQFCTKGFEGFEGFRGQTGLPLSQNPVHRAPVKVAAPSVHETLTTAPRMPINTENTGTNTSLTQTPHALRRSFSSTLILLRSSDVRGQIERTGITAVPPASLLSRMIMTRMYQRVRLGMITATGPSSRLAISGGARPMRGIKSARSVPLQRGGVGTTPDTTFT